MSNRRRRGSGPSLKIIKWRDIPAQVNGTSGDEKIQVELPPRFQKAIDRAAMVAGLKDANSYVAEMGAESRPARGQDLQADVKTLVDELETAFPLEVLNEFVRTGGFDPSTSDQTPTQDPDPFPDEDQQ